jgi:hypothetical protein
VIKINKNKINQPLNRQFKQRLTAHSLYSSDFKKITGKWTHPAIHTLTETRASGLSGINKQRRPSHRREESTCKKTGFFTYDSAIGYNTI